MFSDDNHLSQLLRYSYSIAVKVTESDYASVVFTGEGTEDIKAIVTQFGNKNVALPTLERYGYTLTGFEDEDGNRIADVFKFTINSSPYDMQVYCCEDGNTYDVSRN